MGKPWAELTDHECNALVAKEVMGWQYCQRETVIINKGTGERTIAQYWVWVTPTGEEVQDRHLPCFKTDIAAAWEIVNLMTSRMGYDYPGFDWMGPLFKPEHHYLTQEGYPLGTTCWFVRLGAGGLITNVCADTPEHAICLAALKAAGYEGEL